MSYKPLFPESWGLTPLTGSRLEALLGANNPIAQSPYISPYAENHSWANLNATTIARHFFYRLPVERIYNHIFFVKEPECQTDIKPIKRLIYLEQNAVSGFQAEQDTLLYTCHIYVSTNGSKLQNLYDCTAYQIADNEIYFFLEDNTNDLSDQVLLARFGKGVDKKTLLAMADTDLSKLTADVPDFSTHQLRELLETGRVKAPITPLRSLLNGALFIGSFSALPGKATGWLTNQIGDLIAQLAVPETLWDAQSETYFLQREQLIQRLQIDLAIIEPLDLLLNHQHSRWFSLYAPQSTHRFSKEIRLFLKKLITQYNQAVTTVISGFYDQAGETIQTLAEVLYLSEKIAFFCGLWNGIVDFVAGIFKFIGLLELPYNSLKNFQATLESLDNLMVIISEISLSDLFFNGLRIYIDMTKEVFQFMTTDNPRAVYNFDKIAYFIGFGIGNIGASFIPILQLSKVTSISKFGSFLTVDFLQAINNAPKQLVNDFKQLLLLLEQIGTLLAKKGAALYAELHKILRKIFEWFKRNELLFSKKAHAVEKKLLAEVEKGLLKLDEFPNGLKRHASDYTRYTNYSEIKALVYMESNTFKIGTQKGKLKYIALDKVTNLDAPIKKGIDAIYEFSNPPPKYVIAEVKMNTTGSKTWQPKVDTKKTGSGDSQMTTEWIEFNLPYFVTKKVQNEMIKNNYESILIGISNKNEVILKSLNENAKVTSNKIIKTN